MNSFTFDHIALSVRDVAKSVRFYQHVFDLTEIENTAAKSATRWLSLGEGKELHLIPRPEAEIKTNKAVHFALATPRFDAFIPVVRNNVVNKEKLRIFAEVGFGLGAIK